MKNGRKSHDIVDADVVFMSALSEKMQIIRFPFNFFQVGFTLCAAAQKFETEHQHTHQHTHAPVSK